MGNVFVGQVCEKQDVGGVVPYNNVNKGEKQMKYRDRQGREYEQTTSQDSFLAAAYSSAMGRALMKFLGCPIFSKCARVILDSKFSVPFIFGFAEKNGIDMFDYEERMYRSFNDFSQEK